MHRAWEPCPRCSLFVLYWLVMLLTCLIKSGVDISVDGLSDKLMHLSQSSFGSVALWSFVDTKITFTHKNASL